MPITFTCSCGRELAARPEHAGHAGRCPACGATVPIPAPTEAEGPLTADYDMAIAAEVLRPRAAAEHAVSETPCDPFFDLEEALVARARPTYRLFRPSGVVWATFFSNFFGGTVILALNYYRLGNRRAAWATFLIGGGLLPVYLAAFALGPAGAMQSASVATIVTLWVMWFIAKRLQGDSIAAHVRIGGRMTSNWAAVGIGVLCAAAMLGLVAGLTAGHDLLLRGAGYLLPRSSLTHGTRLAFSNGEEVYYKGGITEAEARRVGNSLKEYGYFNGTRAMSVQVRKDGANVVVAFVVRDGVWDSPGMVRVFTHMGVSLAADVFDDRRVIVELCDTSLRARKTIPPGEWQRRTFGPNKMVFYRNGVTEVEAQRIGNLLQRVGLFVGDGEYQDAQVRKDGNRFVVTFVLADGVWDEPVVIDDCTMISGALSHDALDGRPVRVELEDTTAKVRRTIASDDPG